MREVWKRRVVAHWILRIEDVEVVTRDSAQQWREARGNFITFTRTDGRYTINNLFKATACRNVGYIIKTRRRTVCQPGINGGDVVHHVAVEN